MPGMTADDVVALLSLHCDAAISAKAVSDRMGKLNKRLRKAEERSRLSAHYKNTIVKMFFMDLLPLAKKPFPRPPLRHRFNFWFEADGKVLYHIPMTGVVSKNGDDLSALGCAVYCEWEDCGRFHESEFINRGRGACG